MRRIVKLPPEYMKAISAGTGLFPPLYQFENGLRLVINEFLSECYTRDWWEISLRAQLPSVYEYAQNQMDRRDHMPWVGNASSVDVLPIHLVTLGHLEEIVKKYRPDCIPELFPTLEFFLGHTEVIKRVRNLYAHMFPCISPSDITLARREILTLSSHINARLE